MKKLTCKITFNHIFENLISSSFRDIHLIEIIEVLKENIAKGENIGISKITLKDNKPISELKFSKFFKILDVIEKNSNEYICLVKVSIPEKFSNLLKWLDLEILWDRPIIMTEKSVEYSCIGSEKNLKKILKFSNILGKITAISYKEANYNKYNFLSNLTPKEEKIMIMAIKYGYYEYPRKINATKLAKMQKNSKSTVIEHLRKAENKVILSILENQVNGDKYGS